jgi:flagellar basal-body rod modification protein FlgD
MLTTNPITGATSGTATASNSVPANMQINQTDFLKLITTQLRSQNPLSPTDPTQFVSQLEGMSQVSSMQSIQSSLQAQQVMSGTTLLGHSVLAPGTTATLATGGSVGGAVQAPAGASKLTVSITDSTGAPVATFTVPPQSSGLTPFIWKGTTTAGAAAAAGEYTVAVNATVNGATVPVTPNVVSKVQSVLIDPTTQAVDLDTDGGTVPLNTVISVM